MKLSPQQVRVVATAVTLAAVGGLIHPWSIHVSLPRGIFTWLAASVGSGLVLGSITRTDHLRLLKLAVVPATALPVSYLMFIVVHWLMVSVRSPDMPATIPWVAGAYVDPTQPRIISLLGILALVDFSTSYMAIALCAMSSSNLLLGLTKLFHFGANGVDRVQKLLIGLSALVLAAFGLWNVLVS